MTKEKLEGYYEFLTELLCNGELHVSWRIDEQQAEPMHKFYLDWLRDLRRDVKKDLDELAKPEGK